MQRYSLGRWRRRKCPVVPSRTKMSSNSVPWSTLTNSVSKFLTSSSFTEGPSEEPGLAASTWNLQYSMTCGRNARQATTSPRCIGACRAIGGVPGARRAGEPAKHRLMR